MNAPNNWQRKRINHELKPLQNRAHCCWIVHVLLTVQGGDHVLAWPQLQPAQHVAALDLCREPIEHFRDGVATDENAL